MHGPVTASRLRQSEALQESAVVLAHSLITGCLSTGITEPLARPLSLRAESIQPGNQSMFDDELYIICYADRSAFDRELLITRYTRSS